MPRRNLSVVSKDEDPYRLQRYPVAFQVMLSNGKQAHNARELVKAAKFKGQWLDMARQPIPAAKVREILALTGQRPHANTGRLMPASQLAKLRKLAKRELLARQGKSVVGPMQYRATGPLSAPQPTRRRSVVPSLNDFFVSDPSDRWLPLPPTPRPGPRSGISVLGTRSRRGPYATGLFSDDLEGLVVR